MSNNFLTVYKIDCEDSNDSVAFDVMNLIARRQSQTNGADEDDSQLFVYDEDEEDDEEEKNPTRMDEEDSEDDDVIVNEEKIETIEIEDSITDNDEDFDAKIKDFEENVPPDKESDDIDLMKDEESHSDTESAVSDDDNSIYMFDPDDAASVQSVDSSDHDDDDDTNYKCLNKEERRECEKCGFKVYRKNWHEHIEQKEVICNECKIICTSLCKYRRHLAKSHKELQQPSVTNTDEDFADFMKDIEILQTFDESMTASQLTAAKQLMALQLFNRQVPKNSKSNTIATGYTPIFPHLRQIKFKRKSGQLEPAIAGPSDVPKQLRNIKKTYTRHKILNKLNG